METPLARAITIATVMDYEGDGCPHARALADLGALVTDYLWILDEHRRGAATAEDLEAAEKKLRSTTLEGS